VGDLPDRAQLVDRDPLTRRLESEAKRMRHRSSPLVEAKLADADGVRILLREHLGRPPEALDLVAVLADVPGNLVGRRLRAYDLRLARDADDNVAGLVRVEVQLDVGIRAHVAGFDARCRVDEERVAVPQEPHG